MRYRDAAAFRQALEQRLLARAAGDVARLSRDRKRVAFDRLLARLNETATGHWLLKGGFALDLRLSERARFTRDVDIDWQVAEEELLDSLIEAAALATEDYFTFQVERTSTPPELKKKFIASASTPPWRAGCTRPSCSMSRCLPIRSQSTTRSRHRTSSPSPASTQSRSRLHRSSDTSPRSCTPTPAAMATISRAPVLRT